MFRKRLAVVARVRYCAPSCRLDIRSFSSQGNSSSSDGGDNSNPLYVSCPAILPPIPYHLTPHTSC